jgi:nitrite reductase/ring-hydroxylating ferredoxin subunit
MASTMTATRKRNAAGSTRPARSKGRGLRVPAAGEGGFDQTWYPVCWSSEVPAGEVIGRPFLDGRVAVFRGANGTATVLSPYCRHMGADLSVASAVVGDALRCPFHHWQYDQSGRCSHIPIGGKIPADARLFRFPTRERWGVVWAFNGERALFELPDFPVADDRLLFRLHGPLKTRLEFPLQIANSVDFQHLIVLHGLEVDAYPEIHFEKFRMHYHDFKFRDPRRSGNATFNIDLSQIVGTNILMFGGNMGHGTLFSAFAGTPVTAEGQTYSYLISAVLKGGEDPAARQMQEQLLAGWEAWSLALIIEDDKPIMDTISFRADNPLPADKHVVNYLKYLLKYPRAHPSAAYIRA